MPTSYSPLLGLALPVTGELSGTWGDTVNDYITKYLDSSVAGTQTISGSQTAVTLSVTNGTTLVQVGSGATGSAQYQVINCTGNPASMLTVTVPAQSKTYVVVNATSTSQQVKVVGVGPTTGVTLDAGEKAVIAWNGSDFIKVATSTVDGVSTISFGTTGLTPSTATSGAVTVAGTLVAANGGTGQSTYTTGDLLYATGSTALSKLGIGTNGQILTSTGTAPQWSTLSGVAVTTFSAGTTGFTPSSATSGAITLAGTLATTNGGTGLTSFTANGVVYASSTSALATGSDVVYTGNFGIGTSSPTYKLNVVSGAGAQNIFQAGQSGVSNGYTITSDGTNLTYQWFTPSTEAMRLNSTGLGIGTSSPGAKLHAVSAGSASTYTTTAIVGDGTYPNSGFASLEFKGFIGGNGYTSAIGTNGGQQLRFYTPSTFGVAPTLQMTLNESGNLGIGTSSPDQALVVNKASGSTYVKVSGPNNVNNDLALHFTDGTNNAYFGMMRGTSGGVAGALHSYTGGAIRSTLDSSGNLGLGVTPSAWSGFRAMQIGGTTSLWSTTSGNGSSFYTNNGFFNGSNRIYLTNGFATEYIQGQGQHIWYTAPSGTAGNTISFSQVMTLDASGNLGIGTTSPGQPLVVSKNQNGSTWAQVSNTTSGTGAAAGLLLTSDSSIQATVELDSSTYTSFANMLRIRQIGAYPIGFLTSDTLRATITGAGDVGIGTTSPVDNGAGYKTLTINSTTSGVLEIQNNGTSRGQLYSDASNFIFNAKSASTGYKWNLAGTTSMTLDSSGNLGLGVTPSAWASGGKPLQAVNASFWGLVGTATFSSVGANYFYDGAYKYISNGVASDYYQLNGAHGWRTAASGTAGNAISFTQAMTLDAGGRLLLGTTSSIDNNLTLQIDTPASSSRFIGINRNGGYGLLIGYDLGGVDYANIRTVGAYPLTFGTNNTERARIDSSGNLGLGVTPSAWGSVYKALQLTDGAAFVEGGGNTYVGNNWYNNGSSGIYIANGAAAVYGQSGGQHQWFNAPSGTAGNIATFTQAMTLDASGNLLLGQTSQDARFNLNGPSTSTSNPQIRIRNSADGSGNSHLDIGYYYQSGVGEYGFIQSFTDYGSAPRDLLLQPRGGNVGIGTSSPAARLHAYGTSGAVTVMAEGAVGSSAYGRLEMRGRPAGAGQSAGYIVAASTAGGQAATNIGAIDIAQEGASGNASFMAFSTHNGTSLGERARITSGGELLINTTTSSGLVTVARGASGVGIGVSHSGDAGASAAIRASYTASTGTAYQFDCYFNGGRVGYISSTSTATAYNTSSDYRLKNNPQPLTGSGAFIDALQPKTWDWKTDGSKGVGFIAHEVQEVSPGSVVGTKDAVDEEGNPIMQGMEYGSAEFIANIIAELQSLRARVAQLEAK